MHVPHCILQLNLTDLPTLHTTVLAAETYLIFCRLAVILTYATMVATSGPFYGSTHIAKPIKYWRHLSPCDIACLLRPASKMHGIGESHCLTELRTSHLLPAVRCRKLPAACGVLTALVLQQ